MGHDGVYTDKQGNEFPVTFSVMDYTDTHSRVSENGLAAQVGYLAQDDDSINPRVDYDNFGIMVCFSRKYNLGDKHHYADSEEFMRCLAADIDPDINGKIDALHNDKYQELISGGMSHDSAVDTVYAAIDKLISDTIKGSGTIMLPLYLMDHSSLSMSVRDFSDQWDSGQVGVIYATGSRIKEEFGDGEDAVEKATNLLKGEVETYDQYLMHEVYGVNVESFVNIGPIDEPEWVQADIESCWGFFGTKYAEEELKIAFDDALDDFNALAAQKGEERAAMDEAARVAALAKSFVFEVGSYFEPGAGINDGGDTIIVTVQSGEPGGEHGEFQRFMQDALAEWYDRPVQVVDAEAKPSGPKM